MMLDPVDHASDRVTKPNSGVHQRTISSLSRDRSIPTWASTYAASATTSRAAVPSIELATLPANPSCAAT